MLINISFRITYTHSNKSTNNRAKFEFYFQPVSTVNSRAYSGVWNSLSFKIESQLRKGDLKWLQGCSINIAICLKHKSNLNHFQMHSSCLSGIEKNLSTHLYILKNWALNNNKNKLEASPMCSSQRRFSLPPQDLPLSKLPCSLFPNITSKMSSKKI